jgi:hypothetical protein
MPKPDLPKRKKVAISARIAAEVYDIVFEKRIKEMRDSKKEVSLSSIIEKLLREWANKK